MLKHMPAGPVNGQNRTSRGLNRSTQPLNVSTISTASGQPTKLMNGGLRVMPTFATPLPSISSNSNNNNTNANFITVNKDRLGVREALTSLGLLCLVSLLLALLSLIFLLKISPGGREQNSLPVPPPHMGPSTILEDYAIVYDVTLALCALSLSLNLCCLLVCAIQFLFAVKLVRAPVAPTGRGNKYLQKSSVSRVCAVGGFFISIPIFLTGIILYTFTQFHSTPAIVTSILIGVGIVFCGGAMVHNVFVWQREKTICVRQMPLNLNLSMSPHINTIMPPVQFLNHNGHVHSNNNNNHNHSNYNTPLTHTSQISHTTPINQQLTPVTPLSGNHSHISFNHSFGVRTTTPPTPKTNLLLGARDASGSVSPGMPANLNSTALDLSNSPHELSTLV